MAAAVTPTVIVTWRAAPDLARRDAARGGEAAAGHRGGGGVPGGHGEGDEEPEHATRSGAGGDGRREVAMSATF